MNYHPLPSASPAPLPARILVVDDDVTVATLLSDILTEEGYAVVTVTQSLRAYDRAREWRPDLILMDVMMPYLDGLDQVKLLSLDEDLRDTPIVVVSAKARALDGIKDPGALRIMDFVRKPFEIPHLLESVKEAIRVRAVA